MVNQSKQEKAEREAYVRGKFRVEANLPFTLENFEILHQEATKLGEENDTLKTKLASLTTTNFEL
jgi:hypothetical protein